MSIPSKSTHSGCDINCKPTVRRNSIVHYLQNAAISLQKIDYVERK